MATADIDGDGDLDLYCTHYIDVMHLADPTTRFAMMQRDGKMDFPNTGSALVLEYETSIPINKMAAVRKEVDWIWEAFRDDVENAKLTNGVIRATNTEDAGLVTQSKGREFVFTKRDDGQWRCLEDEKK